MFPALGDKMTQRYLPQYNQFGFMLEERGAGYMGHAAESIGSGTAWVMPINEHCLVLEHNIVPCHDMDLLELTPAPYACVSEGSMGILECMPDQHINPSLVRTRMRSQLKMPVYTFVQNSIGENISPLKEGHTYYSRSIIIEPDFFYDLERSYPKQFAGLFDAFGQAWNEDASAAIHAAIHSLRAERSLMPGAHLYAKSVVEGMVAQLALAHHEEREAENASGSSRNAQLVQKALSVIERELCQGHQITIEELAESVYSSRSTLCAVFKCETGEALGAFMRRRRSERAEELLAEGHLSVAQIAAKLGYPRVSAFSHAFKKSHGLAPTEWRKAN